MPRPMIFLYPQRLPVEMGQFARTFQPGLARPSTSLGELFLTACVTYSPQRNPNALAVALALRRWGPGFPSVVFTTASIPYLWGQPLRRVSTARVGRVRPFMVVSR